MKAKWWVHMDWAGAHRVRTAGPGITFYEEFDGPFDSFSEMKKYVIDAGVTEAAAITNQTREWRQMRKADAPVVDW